MRFSIEGEIHTKADLDSFVARFKEIFADECSHCTQTAETSGDTTEPNAQEDCICPQNQLTLVGVVSSIWGEGNPDYTALEIDLPYIPNSLKFYLRGTARLFHRNLPLSVGDYVAVVTRFDVDEDGDCQFYVYNASDIQKIDIKESDLP